MNSKNKKVYRLAVGKLISQYGVVKSALDRSSTVAKYIRHFRKDITVNNDFDCIFQFVGKARYENDRKVTPFTASPKFSAENKNSDVSGNEFLQSFEWRKLRMVALKKYGPKCQCCGASVKDGAVMNVDHIKPRKHYPELALDVDNLQILCHECNHGKGNWDMTDWRAS